MLIRASLALFFRQFSTQSTTAGSIEDDQLLDVSSDWSLVAGCLSSGPPVPPAWRETGVTLLELYWIQASSESKKKNDFECIKYKHCCLISQADRRVDEVESVSAVN